MGCNCKRAVTLEEDYGAPMEENWFGKMIRMLYKCIMFIIVVVLSIIVSPIVILIAIYQITFGKGGIKIPHKIFEMSKLEG
jgi:hypothetical protein